MKQKIVLATGNKGKVKEMADVLADFGFEVIAQTDLGIESPEETGLTFVENAILKARYASEKSGLPKPLYPFHLKVRFTCHCR